ncbi:MAG: hypothetical protein KGI38_01925 [Thaumarchaeota archaeon]|nr:hypothetical protein [Nitrososphaerota archaeon]
MTETSSVDRDSVSVATETNGKGFIGFLVELPGAFTRGRSEAEVLSKVPKEAHSYLEWLGAPRMSEIRGHIVERHHCRLTVEDADGEILLTADRGDTSQDGFLRLTDIARQSGKTFDALCRSSKLKDWVDPSRDRQTFYGNAPKTIEEMFNHVEKTQHYYLSRVGLGVERKQPFMRVRESGLKEIERLFESRGNSELYIVGGESWTVKKVV